MSKQTKSFSLNTIIEKLTPILQPNIEPQQKKVNKIEPVIDWDDIIAEWSYRLPNGFPTMKNGKFTVKSELKVLQEVLTENGIDEMPDFTKKAPTRVREAEEPTQAMEMTKEQLIKALETSDLEQEDLLRMFRMVDAKSSQRGVIEQLMAIKKFNEYDSKVIFRDATETNSYTQLNDLLANPSKMLKIKELISMGEGNLFSLVARTGVTKEFMEEMASNVPYTSVKMGRYEMFLRLFLEGGRSPQGKEAADVMVGNLRLEVKATKAGSSFRLRGPDKIGNGNDVAKYMTRKINQMFGGDDDIRKAEDPEQTSIPQDIMALRNKEKAPENIYYLETDQSWAFVAFKRILETTSVTLDEIKTVWANALSVVYKAADASLIRKMVVEKGVESDGSVGKSFYNTLAAFEFWLYSGASKDKPHFDYFIVIAGAGKFLMIDPKTNFDKLVTLFSTKLKVGSPTTSVGSNAQDVMTSVSLKEEEEE